MSADSELNVDFKIKDECQKERGVNGLFGGTRCSRPMSVLTYSCLAVLSAGKVGEREGPDRLT